MQEVHQLNNIGSVEIVENSLNKKEKLWLRLMQFGAKVGCHQREDRSFSYKGYQYPVCARCTGVILGYIVMPIFLLIPDQYRIYFAVLGALIMFMDWFIQFLKIKESNNIRRFITGVIGGASLLYIYCYLFKFIINRK